MSDRGKLEQRLADALAASQPRGAGFPERMAAGAMRRAQGRRIKRRAAVAAAALAAALVIWSGRAPADGDGETKRGDEVVVAPMPPQPAPGQVAVSPRTSLLWVEAPFDDPVLVDGKRVGTANRPIEVEPGAHEVTLHDSSRQVTRWSVTLAPGQWQRLLVDRRSAAAAPTTDTAPRTVPEPAATRKSAPRRRAAPRRSEPPETCDEVTCLVDPGRDCCKSGALTLASKPAARVFIDGHDRGWTPVSDLELRPGRHRITLAVPSLGVRRTFTVRIEPGQSVRVIRDLQP